MAHAVETLDELQLERLDLLKMSSPADAQEILRGAAASLWRHRPLLCVALDANAPATHIADEMKAFGYRVWRWETPLFNAANHDGRSENPFGDRAAAVLLGFPEEHASTDPPSGAREL